MQLPGTSHVVAVFVRLPHHAALLQSIAGGQNAGITVV